MRVPADAVKGPAIVRVELKSLTGKVSVATDLPARITGADR